MSYDQGQGSNSNYNYSHNGYNNGHDSGYNSGYNNRYNTNYNQGYNQGNNGYQRKSRGDRAPPPPYQGRRLPDRWASYDNVGRDIEGTRFVPFKTPLDAAFFERKNMPEELKFGVKSLIDMATKAEKQIGLVIDLTNTDRYYRKLDWNDYGIEYQKLNCPGHEVNEREDLVEKFISVVSDFIKNPKNDGKLIGVHCTHGLNRTGYLICRYMIDVDNYTAADAISLFEYYRGHEIERPAYKKSLYAAEAMKKGMKAPESVNSEQPDEYVKLDSQPSGEEKEEKEDVAREEERIDN